MNLTKWRSHLENLIKKPRRSLYLSLIIYMLCICKERNKRHLLHVNANMFDVLTSDKATDSVWDKRYIFCILNIKQGFLYWLKNPIFVYSDSFLNDILHTFNPIISIRKVIKHLDWYVVAVKERLKDKQSTGVV